jgi:aminoglycoside phosphotransferase (APT) family kinase protein
VADPGSPVGVDLDAFARWAAAALPQLRGPFGAQVLTGGRSNITVRMSDADGTDFVLRRPPLHGVLPTAHDMGREYRIIHALGPTPVLVPDALALCTDPAVIGAPFYVMAYVPGIVLNDAATALSKLSEASRGAAGPSMIDALIALHGVDVDAVGLGDLARREELIRRQLKRWLVQFEASKTRELPAIPAVHDRLAARIPEQVESTIVHGDFRLGNCIVNPQGSVEAVLDWEICTLGDPRFDVGYLFSSWAEPGDTEVADRHNPTLAPGFSTRDALMARYAERSGRDLAELDYFVAFAHWRFACILEGVLARDLQGARGDTAHDDTDELRRRIDVSALLAEEYAAKL